MQKKTLTIVLTTLMLLAGCAQKQPPLPPVPPMPDDLSPDTWSMPEWVEPPPQEEEPKPAPVRAAAPNEIVYAYEPQKEYVVPVPLGWPADIVLEPGESVRAIATGDRSYLAEGEEPRWEVREGVSEDEHTPIAHIFMTATHAGLRQGVVVTTSRRTYHLTVKSVRTSHVRTVRWTYPHTPKKAVKKPAPLLPDSTKTQRYHVGYVVEAPQPAPDWVPHTVVDDGTKTYLLFSSVVLYQDAPLLRLVGPNGPEMVNVRQVSTVYVIDRLISHAELRVGVGKQAVIVKIRRGALQRIICPGHVQCPKWPGSIPARRAAAHEEQDGTGDL